MSQNPVDRYVEFFISNELEHLNTYHAKQLAETPPEKLAAYLDSKRSKFRDRGEKLAAAIRDKSELLAEKLDAGAFQPDNKATRGLFEDITGLLLPKTQGGTYSLITQYAAEAVASYRDKQKTLAEEAAENHRVAEEAATKSRLADTKQKYLSGEAISADGFIELAKSNGIELHPRTVGSILRTVSTVDKRGRVQSRISKPKLSQGLAQAFHSLNKALTRDPIALNS